MDISGNRKFYGGLLFNIFYKIFNVIYRGTFFRFSAQLGDFWLVIYIY